MTQKVLNEILCMFLQLGDHVKKLKMILHYVSMIRAIFKDKSTSGNIIFLALRIGRLTMYFIYLMKHSVNPVYQ